MTARATSIGLLMALAILVGAPLARAGDEFTEYQVKAEFIERFTRFIDWPESHPVERDPRTPFVIGVIGKDPFGSNLRNIAEQRTIKGHAVDVRAIRGKGEIDACDVLFIAASEKSRISEILSLTRGKPILTLGDTPGFGEAGVLINLYTEDNKVRFEINAGAVEKSGLKVTSKLFKLARVIGPNGG